MGGDSVATHGPVVLTVTAFGEAPCGRALRRNGATPGDLIFVSGTIGDAALGLRAVQGHLLGLDDASATALAARYRLPEPRMALGTALVGVANAAADVSDGLVADLGHIVDASGVGAVVNWDCVPISTAARAAAAFVDDLPSAILTGGDDYELVFTASLDAAKAFPAMARRLDIPLSEIGVVTAGEGVRVVGADGLAVPLGKTGYVHC
jgi:thiamine-monophosphate kinase